MRCFSNSMTVLISTPNLYLLNFNGATLRHNVNLCPIRRNRRTLFRAAKFYGYLREPRAVKFVAKLKRNI